MRIAVEFNNQVKDFRVIGDLEKFFNNAIEFSGAKDVVFRYTRYFNNDKYMVSLVHRNKAKFSTLMELAKKYGDGHLYVTYVY